MSNFNGTLTRNQWFAVIAASTFILINLSPYLLLRENGRYLVGDNLDSNHVWYKVLIESGHLFSSNSTIVESMMGGLPRSLFPSEFNLTTLLYAFLGPLYSYLLERFIAFAFAFAFASDHFALGEEKHTRQLHFGA